MFLRRVAFLCLRRFRFAESASKVLPALRVSYGKESVGQRR
jgi:hypothetical protein